MTEAIWDVIGRGIWDVIGRGKMSWHAETVNRSSSGGVNPDAYAKEAVDGALVYDAMDADYDAFSRMVISGPMLNLRLPPDGIERMDDHTRQIAGRMAGPGGLGGAFKTLATKAATDREFSGLDYVGVGVYERLLREVPGVKFGRVQRGRIVWEKE